MAHGARDREDAAWLVAQELTEEYTMWQRVQNEDNSDYIDLPYVAVATNDGLLVNQHLGEAISVNIYNKSPKGYQYVERRDMPKRGSGDSRWLEVAKLLKDCRAMLVSGVGEKPKAIITRCGTRVVEMTGLIEDGLEGIYENKQFRSTA